MTLHKAKLEKTKRHRVTRALLIVAGSLCVALGAVGIFIPILPTTPFLLLAAACYCRSSDRLYQWLMGNRWFGTYIRNYREGKGLSIKTKIIALTVLWVSISYSALFWIDILILQVVLLAVAVGVSTHIIRLPTFRKSTT
jgi:uncharacterized protein